MSKKTRWMLVVMAVGTVACPAQLMFENPLQELTVTPDLDTATVDFPFTVGPNGAEIVEFDAPCTCLEAKISDNGKLVWKPGEKGTVKGVFKTGSLKGKVDKTIVLRLKSPTAPLVKLTLRLTIPELLEITPGPTLFWDQGGKGEAKSFKLKVNNDEPIHILETSGTNENFAFELKTIKDGREYELVVTPQSTVNRAFGLIRIRTDSKFARHQRYQCFVVVRRPQGASAGN
jgi:hypothetical protein